MIFEAGDGLFATKNFRNNQIILPYLGQELDYEELDRRYDYDNFNVTAPYAINSGDHVIDAACRRGVAGYINSPRGTRLKSNAIITKKGIVRATRGIRAKQEILVGYSSSYWAGLKYIKVINRVGS